MAKIIALILVLLMANPAFGAMSDSDALLMALSVFGPAAMIGQVRNTTDAYWTKQVGIASPQCRQPFTILVSGLNTWDDAFTKVVSSPISGPFKSTVTLTLKAWDNAAVSTLVGYIDGVQAAAMTPSPALPNATSNSTFNTATVPDGLHVLCVVATDPSGNMGRSDAYMFRTDQVNGQIGAVYAPQQAPYPSVTVALK